MECNMGISVKTFSATGEGLEYKKEHSKQALTEQGTAGYKG